MFELPKSCLVNRFIPKKKFYEKVGLASNIKQEFIDLIDKITWVYKLSEDTLGVSSTSNVEEIQIFELVLKENKIPEKVIKVITKSIPYPILFVIKYNDNICYSIKATDNYYTKWNEDINISFKGNSLEYIYEQIVKAIIQEEDNTKEFEEIIQLNDRKKELEKQIIQIRNKVMKEKQFNRKVELNQKLRKLEEEMGKLGNVY